MGELQAVVFSLNNELYGVDTMQIQGIERYQEITKVPDMPDFIDGIINLRGKVIPVVNLNRRFRLGETDITRKTKIVITEINATPVGYIVNDVLEIIKLTDEDMEVPPEIIKKAGNSYIKSVGKKGDKLITVLDLTKVLDENEARELA